MRGMEYTPRHFFDRPFEVRFEQPPKWIWQLIEGLKDHPGKGRLPAFLQVDDPDRI